MSKKCKAFLAWFVAGQVTQIVLNILASTNYMRHPILFCMAAGFLVLVAVGVGMYVAGQEKLKPKSYMDYAEQEVTE